VDVQPEALSDDGGLILLKRTGRVPIVASQVSVAIGGTIRLDLHLGVRRRIRSAVSGRDLPENGWGRQHPNGSGC
jgi:hypothetical protein